MTPNYCERIFSDEDRDDMGFAVDAIGAAADRVLAAQRLEELRSLLRAECISWGELAELQGLAPHIAADDVELREAAGLPEYGEEESQ